MIHKPHFRILSLLFLVASLALSGCESFFRITSTSGTAPTPVVSFIDGGVDNPDVFVDPLVFRQALLQALTTREAVRLQSWMTASVLAGVWRGDLPETSPENALKILFTDQLGAGNNLNLVKDADLKALLGGKDPLSIPRSAAGVTDAFLVSGWGKDGNDEAILFIARQPADDLKFSGWMVIKGGFSGSHLGGVQLFEDKEHGFSVYIPKGYEVNSSSPSETSILPPGEGPGRGIAWINVEPANGRTAEQVVEAIKADLGEGFNVKTSAIQIEDTQALIVLGIPGQDSNRQVFMVHGEQLYHLMFSPDDPLSGAAYQQMQDLYALILNTFHFTQ